MYIVAKQGIHKNGIPLYMIYHTDEQVIAANNLIYDDCIEAVRHYKQCSYGVAKRIVDHAKPFDFIAKRIRQKTEPDYMKSEPEDMQGVIRATMKRYNSNPDFRKGVETYIAEELKEIPAGTGVYDIAKRLTDKIFGRDLC